MEAVSALDIQSGWQDELAREVAEMIREYETWTPRSQQKAPGASELGNTCDRALAYKSRGTGKSSRIGDPLAAAFGSAYHARMEKVLRAANRRIGRERYLIEQRLVVHLPDGTDIKSTADCYDTEKEEVIDWKVLGKTSADGIKRHGPSAKYKTQIQIYGLGMELVGKPVKRVALVIIPRSNPFLGEIFSWSAPYDRQVAEDALARYQSIATLPDLLGVDEDESRWASIGTGEKPDCHFCPYYRPGEPISSTGCPGPNKYAE